MIKDFKKTGFVIGLHPRDGTYNNVANLIAEKNRFQKATGLDKIGGRHHNLCFQAPTTWRLWEKAGLVYDSTLGYADHEGFRCGTCHPYKPYDFYLDKIIDIVKIPLIVMDVTLMNYRCLKPEDGIITILELAQKSKNVNGVITLL